MSPRWRCEDCHTETKGARRGVDQEPSVPVASEGGGLAFAPGGKDADGGCFGERRAELVDAGGGVAGLSGDGLGGLSAEGGRS